MGFACRRSTVDNPWATGAGNRSIALPLALLLSYREQKVLERALEVTDVEWSSEMARRIWGIVEGPGVAK